MAMIPSSIELAYARVSEVTYSHDVKLFQADQRLILAQQKYVQGKLLCAVLICFAHEAGVRIMCSPRYCPRQDP